VLAALGVGARPTAILTGGCHRDSDITGAASFRARIASTNTEDEDASAKHTEMNMTEGNKNQANAKHPSRAIVRFDLNYLMKYGLVSTRSRPSRLCTADDFRRNCEAAYPGVSEKLHRWRL
jgi:hypothetical protein